MNDNLKITILIAEYNTAEKELRESLESILNQTYENFEVLIIDDCSKEENIEIINSYKDSRIKVIKNEKNMGLAASLNKGINLIETKYFIRMDTDDIAERDRIEKQVEFATKHPEYSIIGSRANYFEDSELISNSKKYGEIEKEDLIKGTPFIHPTLMIKTADIKKTGGYPLYRRCQDYAMAMNMYANGYKGYIMEEVLLNYRVNSKLYKNKKYRFVEAKIRFTYYRKMKLKMSAYIYCLKPIIAGFIPKRILNEHYKQKLRNN